MNNQIFEKVKTIIMEQLNINSSSQIKLETLFDKDLGIDSLDMIELIMNFEESFTISISEEDSENFRSVKDVVDYITSKKTISS